MCRSIVTELIDGIRVNRSRNVVIKIRSWVYRELCLRHGCSVGHAILTIISCGHASPASYWWLDGCLRDGNELQLSRRYDRSYLYPAHSLLYLNEAHSASSARRFLVCVKRSHLLIESFFESSTWDWIFYVRHSIDFNCSIVINAYILSQRFCNTIWCSV